MTWKWQRRPPLRVVRRYPPISTAVSDVIRSLIDQSILLRVPPTTPVFTSRIFLVPKRDCQAVRLVVDLSALNRCILNPKFKMLTVHHIRQTMLPLAWMVSLNLSDAYWHVPVHRRFQRFLAIPFVGHPYVFQCTPFGLNVAPRVFTKIVRQTLLPLLEKGLTILK